MGQDKLQLTTISKLTHNDRFGWEIQVFGDVTDITYKEWDENGKITRSNIFSIPFLYDLQVFEEAIRLRKLENNEQ